MRAVLVLLALVGSLAAVALTPHPSDQEGKAVTAAKSVAISRVVSAR